MSNCAPAELQWTSCDKMGQTVGTNDHPTLLGALPFLLQPDPQAVIEVELVDQPVVLRQSQFEALLVDSECEV